MFRSIVLSDIENYADKKGIPIMEKEGILFLKEFIKLNNIKNILEIGSAIGYSAINMALVNSDINIVTIEKDNIRYLEALKNIKKMNLDKQISLVLSDALNFNTSDKYDLIFIDASKTKYIEFFNKFSKNLEPKGFIVTDNIKFHNLVHTDKSQMSKNVKGLVNGIERYIEFLKENKEFKT
ncbi:MAG TPA: class I SAM-dependent methyltransferase, partial [Bacilli bacterium]|nr:class I SAM-dependent methyltransferase [Bacilli bacterium]